MFVYQMSFEFTSNFLDSKNLNFWEELNFSPHLQRNFQLITLLLGIIPCLFLEGLKDH